MLNYTILTYFVLYYTILCCIMHEILINVVPSATLWVKVDCTVWTKHSISGWKRGNNSIPLSTLRTIVWFMCMSWCVCMKRCDYAKYMHELILLCDVCVWIDVIIHVYEVIIIHMYELMLLYMRMNRCYYASVWANHSSFFHIMIVMHLVASFAVMIWQILCYKQHLKYAPFHNKYREITTESMKRIWPRRDQ